MPKETPTLNTTYINAPRQCLTYSRTPVTQTLKGDEKRFKLAGVRVIGVDQKFNFSCK